jgi:NAD-dependent deacetylase
MVADDVVRAADLLREAQRVAVLTGAGVSAESGVPTFRGAGGLWEGHAVERVASPEGLAADPLLVWRFYEQRRQRGVRVAPNPGHAVLARWQDWFAAYTLITQNIDGLHALAGSRDVLELHGNLWWVRCTACGREREERTVPLPELPPHCPSCGAMERPAVVWFGEGLPMDIVERATLAAAQADVLLVVGTSAVVYPAAGLIAVTASNGGRVIEVNPEPSALAHIADIVVRGPSGVVLPEIDALLGEAP